MKPVLGSSWPPEHAASLCMERIRSQVSDPQCSKLSSWIKGRLCGFGGWEKEGVEKRLPAWGSCCFLRGFRACKNTFRPLNGNIQITVTLIEREETKWTRGQDFTVMTSGLGVWAEMVWFSPQPSPSCPSLFPGLEILEGSRRDR